MSTPTINDRLSRLVNGARAAGLRSKATEEAIARRMLPDWSQAEKDEMAVLYVSGQIWESRRARQRETERAAERAAETAEQEAAEAFDRALAEERAGREAERARRAEEIDRLIEQQRQERREQAAANLPLMFPALRNDPVGVYVALVEPRRAVPTKRDRLIKEAEQAGERFRPYRLEALRLYEEQHEAKYPDGRCAAAKGGGQCANGTEPGEEFCPRHSPEYQSHQPELPPDAQSRFAEWLGGADAYKSWLRTALESWRSAGWDTYRFAADWYPGGPLRLAMDEFADDIAAKTRLEMTEELLGSEFALGDGRRVTWRDATRAEHEQRIAMVMGNATANVEDAVRHRVAIQMIEDAGGKCLGDIGDSDGWGKS